MPVSIPSPTPDGICAIVVTYEPDAGFEERISALERQVKRIVVVDNASSQSVRRRLDTLQGARHIDLVCSRENAGIGAALNRGLEHASAIGFPWALTFDQDSIANDDLVSSLVEIHAAHPDHGRLAILGANYEEEATGATGTQKRRREGSSYLEVDQVITSGCLQSVDLFRAIGPYREDLFMYYVDNEYCARARLAGYRVVLSKRPLIRHRTGNQAVHQLGFMHVATANYAPWRYYYIVRNGLALSREYFFDDPVPSLRRTYNVVKRSALALAFESDRAEKLRFIARGVKDGIAGKTGKQPGILPSENGVHGQNRRDRDDP
jgi:rhamnosyltransferase